jgi:uncharacterized damage-inducible protein DinB
MLELLRHQIDYTAWADQRVLSAAAQLTPGELDRDFKSADQSIRLTLAHTYQAERNWLGRVGGKLADRNVEGYDTIAALSANWPQLHERWQQWSQTLTEQQARADLTYQDLKGNTWTQALWKIIHHVSNHSTHHRGQAIGFIRALGHTPPNVDSTTFARYGKANGDGDG